MSDTWCPIGPTGPILRVRIDLDEVDPPIWRLLEIPPETTLNEVHALVQMAMGWEDSHLHGFARGDFWQAGPADRFVMDVEIADGLPGVPESLVRIADVLVNPGDTLSYVYDYGDGWEHTMRLEDVRSTQAVDTGRPPSRFRLLDGSGACPPENCGGVGGFEDLLIAAAAWDVESSSVSQQDRDRLEWALQDGRPGERGSLLDALTHADLDRAGALVASLGRPAPALPAPVAAMLAKSRDRSALQELTTLAGFTSPELPAWDLPDVETAERIVAPFAWFIGHVGDDGLALTAAGYLRPVDVRAVADVLDLSREWPGLLNREVQTLPVLQFREAAQALGLVRKAKGRLVVPARVKKIAGDPMALFGHLANHLPAGRGEAAQDAGWILLLSAVDGAATSSTSTDAPLDADWRARQTAVERARQRRCEAAMASIGWRVDGSPMVYQEMLRVAEVTATTLQRAGEPTGRRRSMSADAGWLARAALLAQV